MCQLYKNVIETLKDKCETLISSDLYIGHRVYFATLPESQEHYHEITYHCMCSEIRTFFLLVTRLSNECDLSDL